MMLSSNTIYSTFLDYLRLVKYKDGESLEVKTTKFIRGVGLKIPPNYKNIDIYEEGVKRLGTL